MTRGDQFRTRAAAAEDSAAKAANAELRREFLDLAEKWRDLARQADAYDEAVKALPEA